MLLLMVINSVLSTYGFKSTSHRSHLTVLYWKLKFKRELDPGMPFPCYCVRCNTEKSAFEQEFYAKQETITNVTTHPLPQQIRSLDSRILSAVEIIPSFIKKNQSQMEMSSWEPIGHTSQADGRSLNANAPEYSN